MGLKSDNHILRNKYNDEYTKSEVISSKLKKQALH